MNRRELRGNEAVAKALEFFDIDAKEIDRRLRGGENPFEVETDIKERCKRQYPRLLKKYHPDTNPDDISEAERHEQFLSFKWAKDIIENEFKIIVRKNAPVKPVVVVVRYNMSPTNNNFGFGQPQTNFYGYTTGDIYGSATSNGSSVTPTTNPDPE